MPVSHTLVDEIDEDKKSSTLQIEQVNMNLISGSCALR